MSGVVVKKTEYTNIDNLCIFSKTDGPFGFLSNMAPGFPININGYLVKNTEALYQACKFPDNPEFQKEIISLNSPMISKSLSREYDVFKRDDWSELVINIMRWVLRVKLAQNFDTFGPLLLSTGDKQIVEFSNKSNFWGASFEYDNFGNRKLVGGNVLGLLLTELRNELQISGYKMLFVKKMNIPNFKFMGKPITHINEFENLINKVKKIENSLINNLELLNNNAIINKHLKINNIYKEQPKVLRNNITHKPLIKNKDLKTQINLFKF